MFPPLLPSPLGVQEVVLPSLSIIFHLPVGW